MKIDTESVAKSVAKSFDRPQKYPTLTVRGLKNALSLLSEEYDEVKITYGFLLEDRGPADEDVTKKNFVIGTIPLKCLVRHPDQIQAILCDDALLDYFNNFTNIAKTEV